MSYDLFVSYANKDNERGQVRELSDAIHHDFRKFAGRDLRVFFDEQDIPSMVDWENQIDQALRESRLFLAVLSPNYFASKYCRHEWEEYIRYEAMRQCLGEGVAPVYFVELPVIDGAVIERSIAHWVTELRKRQWCDLLSWYNLGKSALEDAHIAERLHGLKTEIKERLSRVDRARQSPTNIYRHNPQFVGRVRELTILREALAELGSVGVVGHTGHSRTVTPGATAVHGLGGMGKTELALAYSHAFAWDYPGGRWLVRCETLDNFDLVLRQLAEPRALNLTFTDAEQKDVRLAGERVLAELGRRERSLLLLDNVTHPELLGPDVLMRLPAQSHVHVIATTRLGPAQLAGGLHDHSFIAVDELPGGDALALIRAHQPSARFSCVADEAAAIELVKLLDGFTLAVETAAIYLGRHAAPGAIAEYTQRIRIELLATDVFAADSGVGVRHKEKLLERTLAITFETLSVEQLRVLALGALLPADQIALPWVRAVASEEFSALKDDSESTVWQRLGDSLLSLRLFEPGNDVRIVRMHRLVQELINNRERALIQLLRDSLARHAETRCQFLEKGWLEWDNRWEIDPLRGFAEALLERGHPGATFLAGSIGKRLFDLARYADAEPLARRMLAIDKQRYGPSHPNVAKGLNNLAQLLKAMNRLNEAEPMMRRALVIDEQHFGHTDAKVAIDLNNLARLLQETNRLKEAEPLMRRAVSILEQNYGVNHPDLAALINNLASLLQDTNRLNEAEPLIRRALAIAEQNYGPHHYKVAKDLNNLASLLLETNRLNEAEPLMRRALAIDEQSYGPNHPDVARDLNNLAQLLKTTNRLAEAEPMMRRGLEIAEQTFGPAHPDVAVHLNNFARLLQAMNRLKEAEPLLRRALMIDEQSFGPEHPSVAIRLNNLALWLVDSQRPNEAEPLFRRALMIDEQSFGPEHPSVATKLNNLGTLLKVMNRMTEAEPLIRRALAIDERSFGSEHPKVSNDLNNLARLLQATQRPTEAEPLMRRALAIDEKSFGPEHPDVATKLNNLAQLLTDTHRMAEAEPMLRRALAIVEQSFGPRHPNVIAKLHSLAQLLWRTKRLTEAEPLLRRIFEISEQTYGADNLEVQAVLERLTYLLRHLDRPREAEPLLRRLVEMCERKYGIDHFNVLARLQELARVLQALNRLAEAEPLFRRAVRIAEKTWGVDHDNMATPLQELAELLQATNGLTEAESLLRRVVEIKERNDRG